MKNEDSELKVGVFILTSRFVDGTKYVMMSILDGDYVGKQLCWRGGDLSQTVRLWVYDRYVGKK